MAAGLRTDWILNEEERNTFLLRGQQKHNPMFDSEVCEITDEPNRLARRILITEAEQLEITEYVKMSELFEASKVNDMEISLIGELIR